MGRRRPSEPSGHAVTMASMRVAVVDVGSNTARLLVADVTADGRVSAVLERRERLGLGAEIAESGALCARTVDTVAARRRALRRARTLTGRRAHPGDRDRTRPPGTFPRRARPLPRGGDRGGGERAQRRRGGAALVRRRRRAGRPARGGARGRRRRRWRLDRDRRRRRRPRTRLGRLHRSRLDPADQPVPPSRPAAGRAPAEGARRGAQRDGPARAARDRTSPSRPAGAPGRLPGSSASRSRRPTSSGRSRRCRRVRPARWPEARVFTPCGPHRFSAACSSSRRRPGPSTVRSCWHAAGLREGAALALARTELTAAA